MVLRLPELQECLDNALRDAEDGTVGVSWEGPGAELGGALSAQGLLQLYQKWPDREQREWGKDELKPFLLEYFPFYQFPNLCFLTLSPLAAQFFQAASLDG